MHKACQYSAMSVFIVPVIAFLCCVPAVFAESSTTADAETAGNGDPAEDVASSAASQAGGSSGGGGPLSKLTVHGFLSQAYATASFSDGLFAPTLDEVVLGIPEDGTFSYRTLAIQFRYEITPKDIMIIQLSSRELGESPVSDQEEEIELDWAFYERRLTDNTSLKIGRVQVPLGIYNEVRDVGTILPFYRPPYTFYFEGTNTSETVDGLVLSHNFSSGSDWDLETDVYFGQWELFEVDPTIPTGAEAVTARAEDAWGLQLWLNTPVPGLRFGLGSNFFNLYDGVSFFRSPNEGQRFRAYYFSVDGTFDRWEARGEYKYNDVDGTDFAFAAEFDTFWLQLGFNVTPQFRIYGQYEQFDAISEQSVISNFYSPLGLTYVGDNLNTALRKEFGVSLNYQFSPNVVLKLEHHFDVDAEIFAPVFFALPDGSPAITFVTLGSDGGDYSILSVSTSF